MNRNNLHYGVRGQEGKLVSIQKPKAEVRCHEDGMAVQYFKACKGNGIIDSIAFVIKFS